MHFFYWILRSFRSNFYYVTDGKYVIKRWIETTLAIFCSHCRAVRCKARILDKIL